MTHIVINAFSAKRGGGITYLDNFLKNIPDSFNEKITLLCFSGQNFFIKHKNIKISKFNNLFSNPFIVRIWELFFLHFFLNKINTDIYFAPSGIISFTLKKSNFKKVTMFRNMIPFDENQKKKWPIGYARTRNWLLGKILLKSMVYADLVIFISEYGKKIILDKAKGNIKNSIVINHGVSKVFSNKPIDPPSEIKKLFSEDYILYPSIVDVYKSQFEVVCAYKKLINEGITLPKLMLVGEEYGKYSKKLRKYISDSSLIDHVIITGPIMHAYMPYIYHKSAFVIYASQSENCPNILLEAMASRKAIICSNYQPMPEFATNSVKYFNPSKPVELVRVIKNLVNNKELIKKLEEKSFEGSKKFDWNSTIRHTLSALIDIK